MVEEKPFWERKSLEEMTPEEWESLCDGCGKCCLYKFQDEDTGEIYYTNVACKFLNLRTTRCTVYNDRSRLMPTCLVLDKDNVTKLNWMPETCAYRLLANHQPLPSWHPLVSGTPKSVRRSKNAVDERFLSEADIDMERLEEYILED